MDNKELEKIFEEPSEIYDIPCYDGKPLRIVLSTAPHSEFIDNIHKPIDLSKVFVAAFAPAILIDKDGEVIYQSDQAAEVYLTEHDDTH